MKTATILHELTPEAILALFTGLQRQIEDLKVNFQPKEPTEFLTRSETAQLLKCDLSTITAWTKKGKLTAYGKGNRVYYKRHEVESSIQPI